MIRGLSLNVGATTCVLMLSSVATPALAWWWPFTSDEETFAEACEEVLKDRLKSPSSCQRLEILGFRVSTSTFEHSIGWDNPDKRAFDEANARTIPEAKTFLDTQRQLFETVDKQIVSAVIKYEASNSFGASMAGAVECIARLPFDGAVGGIDKYDVLVDGFGFTDWNLYQLDQLAD